MPERSLPVKRILYRIVPPNDESWKVSGLTIEFGPDADPWDRSNAWVKIWYGQTELNGIRATAATWNKGLDPLLVVPERCDLCVEVEWSSASEAAPLQVLARYEMIPKQVEQ